MKVTCPICGRTHLDVLDGRIEHHEAPAHRTWASAPREAMVDIYVSCSGSGARVEHIK